MPSPLPPIYFDWQFWAAVVAVLALILSQLPPVILWFRPRRLDVEVHSRINITHKVGNPNAGLFLSIRNTGGRELRIGSITLTFHRDGAPLLSLPALNFFETASSQAAILFIPFTLKPGESWAHSTNFFNFFDRTTEKMYRESESALSTDIRNKLNNRPESDKALVIADSALVQPFLTMFDRLFSWHPGEYVFELCVNAAPGSASFTRKYRFTLFESDTAELRKHTDDYKTGGGLAYNVDRHVGIFVPISQHTG